jgi:chromosome partitioning protein
VDLLREPAKEHSEEKGHAMALDQSALLELLEALKVADVDDRIRSATEALYQALIEAELTGISLDALAVPTPVEGLELIPASALLADTSRLQAEPGNNTLLRNALRKTTPRDWVFIDSPSDLGLTTVMALSAATDVLVPMPAGGMELDELPKVMELITKVRDRLNKNLELAGVLLTKYRMYGRNASVLSRDVAEQLQRDLPDSVLTTVIRDDNRHGEAPAWRKPIALFDPEGRGDQDYRAALEELNARRVIHVLAAAAHRSFLLLTALTLALASSGVNAALAAHAPERPG